MEAENCIKNSALIMKYYDGIIGKEERIELFSHIETCTCCKETFEALGSALDEVAEEGNVMPPDGFERSVMQRLEAYEQQRRITLSGIMLIAYNVSAFGLLAFLVFFITTRQGADFLSFAGDVVPGVASAVADFLQTLINVAISVIKTYYYLIVAAAVLFAAVSSSFVLSKDGKTGRAAA